MCPKDTDALPEKLKQKLLMPSCMLRETQVTLYALSTILPIAGAQKNINKYFVEKEPYLELLPLFQKVVFDTNHKQHTCTVDSRYLEFQGTL